MTQYLYSIYENLGSEGEYYYFTNHNKLDDGDWCELVRKLLKDNTYDIPVAKFKEEGFQRVEYIDELFVNPPDTVEYVSHVSYFVEDGDVQE